jgi:hypothetical protein|tara:strand:- start:239 stop:1111 length:873 start_codon:yes stop_codon:yes gene_type:complete
MSFTFTTLREAVQNYTQNNETSFIANMGVFVELAEERILKSIQLNVFKKNAAGAMTSSNQYLSIPSDFLAPFSLSITTSTADVENSNTFEFLLFKDLDFVESYSPNPATTGVPQYYAQFDVDNFLIGPTPNASYVSTLSYFYRPASLNESLLTLTVGATGSFTNGETITGGTSGVVSTIKSIPSSTTLSILVPSGTFTDGETITGTTSGATTTVTSTGADTTISWLSENAEIALLYATLVEASVYMKEEQDIMAMYNSRFAEATSRLKNLGEAQEVTDQYRTGEIIRQKS